MVARKKQLFNPKKVGGGGEYFSEKGWSPAYVNNITNHIFSENFIKIPKVVQKI